MNETLLYIEEDLNVTLGNETDYKEPLTNHNPILSSLIVSIIICFVAIPICIFCYDCCKCERHNSNNTIHYNNNYDSESEYEYQIEEEDISNNKPINVNQLFIVIDMNQEKEMCCVCIEPMTKGQDIVTLNNCSHAFHKDCITPWIKLNNTCPLCRASVFT